MPPLQPGLYRIWLFQIIGYIEHTDYLPGKPWKSRRKLCSIRNCKFVDHFIYRAALVPLQVALLLTALNGQFPRIKTHWLHGLGHLLVALALLNSMTRWMWVSLRWPPILYSFSHHTVLMWWSQPNENPVAALVWCAPLSQALRKPT